LKRDVNNESFFTSLRS